MAGIGFALKRMAGRDDLLNLARAYVHAGFAASGPWLFTVLAVAGVSFFNADFFNTESTINFRVILIYNFSISLVFSAPIYLVVTRYLADNIHRKDVTYTPSVLMVSLATYYALQFVPAAWFYLFYVDLTPILRISALANLFLIGSIWVLGVFLLALKDYQALTKAFLVGMILAVVFAQTFKQIHGEAGMLNGFSIGLAYILFNLIAKVFAEYPYRLSTSKGLRQYYQKYWELIWTGLFYNAGIWVDKWIICFAPESVVLPSKMRFYPDYDSAMFLAYLTIVPAMAMFVFSVETDFFQRYQRFYFDILEHKSLRRIRESHKLLIDAILRGARNFSVIHGTVCFLAIMLAAQLFEWLNINYMQIGIFRLGCLGAFFHALMLFQLVILSYFDTRKKFMWLHALFFASNTLFTLIAMWLGFPFYGFGYFLASLLSFAVTTHVMFTHIRKLQYHAFITNNNSVNFERPIYHPYPGHPDAITDGFERDLGAETLGSYHPKPV